MKDSSLYKYILQLGDNSMILAHRLSELCGHGPSLETDIALTNISLDLFGQVRSLFQYAAKIKGGDASEDSIAMLRIERDYLNSVLVELPNIDFAHVIVRQYFFDQFHFMLLNTLMDSKDEQLSAIAHKSIKECRYHLRFSSEWFKRLAGGSELSKEKMQTALDHIYPFTASLFAASPYEQEVSELGIGLNTLDIKDEYYSIINSHIENAGLLLTEAKFRPINGKDGIHTEQMGYILSELQYMQRTYPNMTW